jgi:hypothetical protein
MKRLTLFGAFSFLSLALLLGISSADRTKGDTSGSFTPVQTETAPSCRRVQGAACRPEGTTLRCSIGTPPEIRLCVCENGAFNCR